MMELSRFEWRKSSFCSNGNCVEVAALGSQILVRDSKARNGPVLAFQPTEWVAFLEGARRGEFNLPSDPIKEV
jgi:Domain of unknown function (DUF397)